MGRRTSIERPALAASVMLLLPICLAGCWGSVDIERRQFFSILAIDVPDKPEQNAPGGGLLVSMLESEPNSAQLGAGSGGSGGSDSSSSGGSSAAQGTPVLKGEGRYVEDAVANLRSGMGGVLDTSTVDYLVIGKDITPEMLTSAVGTWMFTTRAPMTLAVMTTDGKAADFLRTKMIPGETLQGAVETMRAQSGQGYGFIHHMPQLWQVMTTLINGDGDILLPIMNADRENQSIESPGMAVYEGAKRVGSLTRQESGLACWIAARTCQGGVRFFPFEGDELMARLTRIKSEVRTVRAAAGLPAFTVNVDASGVLLDSGNYRIPLLGRGVLDRIQQALADNMEAELKHLLAKLKGFNSDAMRLYASARLVMRDMSWEEFKRIYPSVKVDFRVKVNLRRDGLLR